MHIGLYTADKPVMQEFDIKELSRINDLIEDLLDLKTIEDMVAEPSSDYEAYSRKRKSRLHV